MLMIFVWTLSYYYHFFNLPASDTMIAYTGSKHVIEFEHTFMHKDADLWVFRNRRVRRHHLNVGKMPFQTFRMSSYSKMLLLYDVVDVPIVNPVTSVVRYVVDNRTVATLWPRLTKWPPKSETNAIDWYNGHVVTVMV